MCTFAVIYAGFHLIFFRIKLVDDASIEYMMGSLQIEVHFDAFRKYLLLEDGEFGLSLCIQIFDKVCL